MQVGPRTQSTQVSTRRKQANKCIPIKTNILISHLIIHFQRLLMITRLRITRDQRIPRNQISRSHSIKNLACILDGPVCRVRLNETGANNDIPLVPGSDYRPMNLFAFGFGLGSLACLQSEAKSESVGAGKGKREHSVIVKKCLDRGRAVGKASDH
uniref:Uncharacterized protein n=1 Tax=Rhizophora mucronata TaxID=61149 RepID=A0A2P2IRU5_RHIMU